MSEGGPDIIDTMAAAISKFFIAGSLCKIERMATAGFEARSGDCSFGFGPFFQRSGVIPAFCWVGNAGACP
ncbi:hypothetical protein CRBSH125_29930 [Afipia carboxidovorans]|nr:hypothetical protein CRBSH125_29930 [Afipia carboxidovorans]